MRFRCLHCDRALSLPDGEERASVTCPSCRERVAVPRPRKRAEGESADRSAPSPPDERVRRAPDEEGQRSRRRRDRDEEEQRASRRSERDEGGRRPRRRRGVGPAKTDWSTMYRIILPVLGVWVVLGFFSILVAGSLFLIGLAVGTLGYKRMDAAFRRMDLLSDYTDAPFWLRGGWWAIYLHIHHTRRRPDVLGLWLFLEVLSVLLLCTSVAICTAVEPPLYPGWSPSVPSRQAPGANPTPPAPSPQTPAAPHVTGDPEVDRALAELADPARLDLRGPAAQRLGLRKPDEKYRAAVARRLADAALGPVEVGRGDAARALVVWATPAEVPDLIRMLAQPGPLREAGGKALRTVGTQAEPALLRALEAETDANVRTEVVDALADVGTRQSVPALRKIVQSREAFVDVHARRAINAIQKRARK